MSSSVFTPDAIQAIKAAAPAGAGLRVDLRNYSVVFDSATLAGLNAGTLSVTDADVSGLSEEVRSWIGSSPVYDISFGDNTVFAGKASVTLPYNAKAGESGIKVYAVLGDGQYEELATKYDNGYVIFETSHFSTFVVKSTDDSSNTYQIIALVIVIICVLAVGHLLNCYRKAE